jgi:hypothetical protein
MKKQWLTYGSLSLFLTVMVASITVYILPPQHQQALAEMQWVDTLNVYTNITTFEPAIRAITNTYDFPVDVKVYITGYTNIAKLQEYKINGNATLFVWIKDGSLIRQENIYEALEPTQTLAFNVLAKPESTLNLGESITVEKKVELYKRYAPPPAVIIPPPVIPPKVPYLDLTIISLPSIVYLPFQSKFTATFLITNKATIGYDVTVKYWLEDVKGNIYDGGQITVFVSGLDKKQVQVQVPTPPVDGTYTLKAETTQPAVVTAHGLFQVTTIPTWLILTIILLLILPIIIFIIKRFW